MQKRQFWRARLFKDKEGKHKVQKGRLWEEERYPLSSSQKNIWNLEQAYKGTPMNNICETIRIRGNFDVALIQTCLNLVLKYDGTLRTRIALDEAGQVWQWETPYEKAQFPVLDFSMTDQDGVLRWEESMARAAMPLLEAPLYEFVIIRIGEHEGELLIKTHHLISDGWSQVALINKIAKTYLNLIEGRDGGLTMAPSYRLHVQEEEKYLSSRMHKKDQDYWRQALAGLAAPASLKEYYSADVSPVGHRKTFYLSEMMNHALNTFCHSHRVAPFAVFYMAVAIYLKRTRGIDRFCMGAPVHNRGSVSDRQTTGMFVSTLPFVSEIREDWSFEEYNSYLSDAWLELLRHQRLSYAEIFAISKEENPSVHRLYHLVLSFHNSQAYKNHNTRVEFSGQWHYCGYQAEHICIHLNNIEDEKRYSVNYDYLTQLFSEPEIENFHNYLMNILTQALAEPGRPIREFSFLSPAEEERVLFGFNRTERFLRPLSLGQKLKEVCTSVPGRAAVIEKGQRFTYQTFWTYATVTAGRIRMEQKEGSGIAALMMPRSLLLLAAMAGCALSGTAWVIVPEHSPQSRIEEILADCKPDMILGTKASLEGLKAMEYPAVFVDMAQLINNYEESGQIYSFDGICTNPNALAYLIYTSGSTGTPKGVEIEHHSLLNFAENMKAYYVSGAVLSICNTGFDAFLIESIAALLNGQTIVLADSEDVENPAALAQLILNYGVGFLTMTPSRLQAYMKDDAFCRALGRVEAIVCGGEPFPGSLLPALAWHTSAKIYNQYGPSETTVGVTTALLNRASSIHVGKPMYNCRCYILDHYKNPLPVGAYGELYISGVCVGRGYHGAQESAARAFMDNPFEPGERMYCTGDIAAWTRDGNIVIKGREDGQVKLRGQRVELGEIRAKLMRYPGVLTAAARVVLCHGAELLTAYYTSKAPIPEQALMDYAASVLPDYMIPAAYMRVDEIPLTANGKADVSALPLPPMDFEGEGTKQTPETNRILEIFRRVLKRPEMPAAGDYFLFGGDSLNALETLSQIETAFGVRLRVADLYACRSAVRLAARICGDGGAQIEKTVKAIELPDISQAPVRESYPLTKTQLGIYFETMMNPTGHSYNMPCAFRLSGKIDRAKLETAFERLIAMEPVLRTGFFQSSDGICQKVCDCVCAAVPVFENMTLETAKDLFVKPFDLTCPPLMRLALWENGDETVVFMDMHHIISDGETSAMLLKELSQLYSGGTPEPGKLSYMDYAWWREQCADRLESDQKAYWEKLMEHAPAPLELPTDFERSASFDYGGMVLEHSLSLRESGICDEFCEKNGVTPFMLFTAAFGLLLGSVSGQKELMVGTPVSNRRSAPLKTMAGLFVNTLPLRLAPDPDKTVMDYMEDVRAAVIGAVDHPDMPLDQLLAMAAANGFPSGEKLYRTLVSIRPMVMDDAAFGGMPAQNVPVPTKSAKLDLNLEIFKAGNCYHFRLEYASALYMESTAAFYARCIGAIAVNLARSEKMKLSDIPKVTAADSFRLRSVTENVSAAYADVPLDQMVDMAAEMAPEQTAMIFRGQVMTLGALKERSDALAASLQEMGVAQREPVGILCRRGEALLVAMMAVLKLGCPYVPMLPSFPKKRLNAMIGISNVRFTLCDSDTMSAADDGLDCRLVDIARAAAGGRGKSYEPPQDRCGSDVCFILFTSGSTGEPKGVMIRHQSIANLYAVMRGKLEPASGGFLCTANSIFDIFITETLLTLAMGKYIVMADEDEMMLPWKCAELIRKYDVQTVEFTPSRASLFVENPDFLKCLRGMPVVLMCGEVFPPELLRTLREAGCRTIYNLYGPTEVTVYCTMDDVTHTDKITVGRIFPNCRAYVLDEHGKRMMPTARGELYFGGACVSAGYVGRDELTKELFVPDPFRPGETLYRSGDIVRLLPDGRIDFVGRADHQIKLNGQRIELAEIQRKLLRSGLVEQAAAVVVPDGAFKLLKAFVTAPAGRTVDMKALRRFLESELPPYMVPARIDVLDHFPVTATGKTDLKALEAMACAGAPAGAAAVRSGGSSSPSAPDDADDAADAAVCTEPLKVTHVQLEKKKQDGAAVTGALLEDLWKQTLSAETVAEDVSFFEQGGTSLGALNLLSRYYSRGLSMTLSQFYAHPTLREHKALFSVPSGRTDAKAADMAPFVSDGAAMAAPALSDAAAAKMYGAQPVRLSDGHGRGVFLTGATGFFGAHLVRALIEQGHDCIYCLVRGGNPKRLWETLEWYFGRGFVAGARKKVHPVSGDILQADLGLAPETYKAICQDISMVIHAAADVRHYAAGDEALATNREGTRHVLTLAERAGSVMAYISTVSLGSEYIRSDPSMHREFNENDFDIGQNWEDNIYLKGKFEAERLVREAAGQGMDVRILRIGRLVGRSSDGVFQKNPKANAFWGLVSGIVKAGMVPDKLADMALDTTAVDECAQAAVLLLAQGTAMVYHLFNPTMYSVREMIATMGVDIEETSGERFMQRLREASDTDGAAIAMLLSQYTRLIQVPVRITPVCRQTVRALKSLGFEWQVPRLGRLLMAFLPEED